MKKFIISPILLTVSILILTCATGLAAAPGGSAGEKFATYANQTYSFRIDYPEKWKVVEGLMGTVVAFGAPKESPDVKFAANANVVVQDLKAYPGMTLQKYDEISLAQTPMLITDFKLIAHGDAEISGIPAKTVVYTGRQGVFRLKFMQLYLLADAKAYVITFTAEESRYGDYEKVARQIVGSFLLGE